MSNSSVGVAVPIPNLLFVLSQKRLALSWAMVVPLENSTDQLVNDGKVNLASNCVWIADVTQSK